MTFNDDDLKRLKDITEYCIANQERDRGVPDFFLDIDPYTLRAFIARLEAGEKCADKPCVECIEADPGEYVLCADHKAWRKAAGK